MKLRKSSNISRFNPITYHFIGYYKGEIMESMCKDMITNKFKVHPSTSLKFSRFNPITYHFIGYYKGVIVMSMCKDLIITKFEAHHSTNIFFGYMVSFVNYAFLHLLVAHNCKYLLCKYTTSPHVSPWKRTLSTHY